MSLNTDRLDITTYQDTLFHLQTPAEKYGDFPAFISAYVKQANIQPVKVILCLLLSLVSFLFVFTPTSHARNHLHTKHSALTLRIELSPAQCSLHPKRSKLRQCREGYAISVSGLRPESYKAKRCSTKRATLPPLQAKVISRIMPDQVVRDLAWQYYGSCMGMSTQNYFRLIARLSGQLRIPKELSSGNNYVVNRALFEQQLKRKNNGLRSDHIQLVCQNTPDGKSQVLTELQVCYDSAGKFRSCAQKVGLSCPASFVIRGLP